MANKEPREGWQPHRAPPFERNRGIVDDKPQLGRELVVGIMVLERVQELSEQLAELSALEFGQSRQQLLCVGEVLGRAGLEQLAAASGQSDQGAPAILGVGIA